MPSSAVRGLIPTQRVAEPTSLAHPAARTGARCGSCGGERLTHLGMTLTDGSPVDFVSCHDCEHKAWSQAGRELPLAAVLGKAHRPRKPR